MKKIAIIRRNGLGDLLCAFPLVQYLQKNEPQAQITLFVDQRNAPLVSYLPQVEEVVVLPPRGNKYFNIWRTARRYRNRYDLAISAKTSPMKLMNVFLHTLQAKKSVAYVDKSWHSRLVSHPRSYDPVQAQQTHQALKGLQLVAPELTEIPEELYPKISCKHSKKPFSLPSTVCLLSATNTRPSSTFPADRLAELLNRLHAESPISVVIIGLPKDAPYAKAIASRLHSEHLVHFPRNFDEFMVFLKAADFYFVGDGGVSHLGAALGKPAVVLFGQTKTTEWRPLSKQIEVLYHPLHVAQLDNEAIYQALKRTRNSGRDDRCS